MDVLASIGLHNLVAMVESQLTYPPSYDAATRVGETSIRGIPPFQSTNCSNTSNIQQRPLTPPRIRMPTEHDSLPNRPSETDMDSIPPPSLLSLEGFSIDGKTGR